MCCYAAWHCSLCGLFGLYIEEIKNLLRKIFN
jgi:hypothetical protein